MTSEQPETHEQRVRREQIAALQAPSQAEVDALEAEVARIRGAARRMRAAEEQQMGSIRDAAKARATRKRAKSARRKNR